MLRLCSLLLLMGCVGPEPAVPSIFEAEVIPVLEGRCAIGCHGVPEADWARYTHPPWDEALFFPIDPRSGRITDLSIARERALHHRVEPGAAPEFSHLLRVPLAQVSGGLPHHGLEIFTDERDPGYQALHRFVERAIADRKAEPLEGPTRFFRDQVLGVLIRNGCFIESCHGPNAFNDLKLEPPIPRPDAALDPAAGFSPRMVRDLRKRVLGKVSRFANLSGRLELSRLIVKNLPIEEGGVHQRGGNGQFFEDLEDPDVQILLAWMRREQAALQAELRPPGPLGELEGVLFIRGPRDAPQRFFEVGPFRGGSDIWLLRDGALENLTAEHFEGPIEVQAFDVRYDAKAIVFSARRGADESFRIYELDLEARRLRSVVKGAGHQLDPVYVPLDERALDQVAVVYASDAAGEWAASSPYGLLGEAEGGGPGWLLDAQRTEAPGTLTGRRISFLAGPHAGEWRRIVDHSTDRESYVGSRLRLDRPLSEAPDRRTVYSIEVREARRVPAFDLWRVVPGGEAERMTFTSAQERRPTLRTTGEVMFTSLRNIGYQADRPVYNAAIFRVMAGGFDYHIHGGNRSRYPIFADSRELPQGLEVRLMLDPRNLWGGGALAIADHGFGVHLEADNPVDDLPYGGGPHNSASQRYLPALLPLFPETGRAAVTHTGRSPGGAFRDPFPLPDGRILVARAPGLNHLDPRAAPDWDLNFLEFEGSLQSPDGQRAGPVRLRPIAAANSHLVERSPRPLMRRLPEKAHTHQKFAWRADHRKPKAVEGVLRMPGARAVVECYDYPLLQSFLTHFAPVGARDFRESELRAVRIVAQQPPRGPEPVEAADPFATKSGLGVHAPSWIVSEVPLERDGSFAAVVPAGVPLKLQGLDAEGMALHSMNRWFYVQPGEKLTFAIPRSIFPLRCAGCHGALTGQRRDAIGPVDVVTSASQVMATWDPTRRQRRPPLAAKRTRIDFRADVQPILDRRCKRCHNELEGRPTRHYTASYEWLHQLQDPASGDFARKRFLNEREALASESPIIARLRKGHGAPTDAELRTLVRWIDLGATFAGAEP